MVSRLEHVGLGAGRETYEPTVRFYEQAFGWHRIQEVAGTVAFVGDGHGGRLEIFASDAAPLVAPHHLAFVVSLDEFDAISAKLSEAGATPAEPFVTPLGDRVLFFDDPAGNRAQIIARQTPMGE